MKKLTLKQWNIIIVIISICLCIGCFCYGRFSRMKSNSSSTSKLEKELTEVTTLLQKEQEKMNFYRIN